VRLAGVPSPTVTQLLGLTLPPSDNFFAETLLKDLGARFGGPPTSPGGAASAPAVPPTSPGGAAGAPAPSGGAGTPAAGSPTTSGGAGTPAAGGSAPVQGTTARGAHVVRETLAELGLHPQVVDASGLSAADQTSPYEVVTLLNEIAHTPLGTILRDDLAVAGHTGTLAERMRGTAAAGRCQGKTGTLTGVSNLAGYCEAADGEELAYAFFDDGIPIATAHTLQDNMAITLADY
jgi:D-alanyl-D-alanine carboxypeptidase/D-alanyl-D-alanine-endopeptidase (penicillin-binding protein 4)